MELTQEGIDDYLVSNADAKYRAFTFKLVNTKYKILGVRVPVIRLLAKKIAKSVGQEFFNWYTPKTYEGIMLYSLVLINFDMPINSKLKLFDGIFPMYDNWAHVDIVIGAFKELKNHRAEFLNRYESFVEGDEYKRRIIAVFLMDYCLTSDMLDTVFELYKKMQCGAYYTDMAIAWGFSVMLVKYYDKTLSELKSGEYSLSVLKKTVQKARDSYRLTDLQKKQVSMLTAVKSTAVKKSP